MNNTSAREVDSGVEVDSGAPTDNSWTLPPDHVLDVLDEVYTEGYSGSVPPSMQVQRGLRIFCLLGLQVQGRRRWDWSTRGA